MGRAPDERGGASQPRVRFDLDCSHTEKWAIINLALVKVRDAPKERGIPTRRLGTRKHGLTGVGLARQSFLELACPTGGHDAPCRIHVVSHAVGRIRICARGTRPVQRPGSSHPSTFIWDVSSSGGRTVCIRVRQLSPPHSFSLCIWWGRETVACAEVVLSTEPARICDWEAPETGSYLLVQTREELLRPPCTVEPCRKAAQQHEFNGSAGPRSSHCSGDVCALRH